MRHFLAVFETAVFISLLPLSGLAQTPKKPKVYVAPFSARGDISSDLLTSLTEEFETALIYAGCYEVVERRDIDQLLKQIRNERMLATIRDLGVAGAQQVQALGAAAVIFGLINDDVRSGEVVISVRMERFASTTIVWKKDVPLPRGRREDRSTRIEAIKKLIGEVCSERHSEAIGGQSDGGTKLSVWMLQNSNPSIKPEGEPLGERLDGSDTFDLGTAETAASFQLARRKPVRLEWLGALEVVKAGNYLFAAGLNLSSRYSNHGYGYWIYHRLLIDNKAVIEVEGKDISDGHDPIVKTATVPLQTGHHSVTVVLAVSWREYSADIPYHLNPEGVTLNLQYRAPGDMELTALSPKTISEQLVTGRQ